MASDAYEQRRGLSFEQAEGLAPLPAQLNRTEISGVLRARVWEVFNFIFEKHKYFGDIGVSIREPWDAITRDEFVLRHGGFIDEKRLSFHDTRSRIAATIQRGTYSDIYGLIQFVIQHDLCPDYFKRLIHKILEEELSAYRIVGGDTLVPIASEEVAKAIDTALTATNAQKMNGAHAHLRNAASELGKGQFSTSVRESISAVESIARVLEPKADLAKALSKIEKSGHLHHAMKQGFIQLYGYTSDEKGIRHSLLADGDAKVDEADALFMLGACASFVSYLIAKKNSANIESAE